MSSKVKNILIFVGIGLVLVLVYFLVFKKTPEQPALVSSTGNAVLPTTTATPDETSAIGKDFLAVLLSVKNIEIDVSIFSDPAFLSLNDSSMELVSDGNEGRPNPFAPLGSDVSAPTNSANLTVVDSTSTSGVTNDTPTLPNIPNTAPSKTTVPPKTNTVGN